MKKCKHCQENVSKDAKKCKHCTGDLRSWPRRHWILTTLGVLFMIGIIGSAASPSTTTTQSSSDTPNQSETVAEAPEYLLEVGTVKFYKSYGYVYLEGNVKNLSGKSMESVQAVGEFYDKDGNFVKSADALIEYNPILAEQTSPFKVITSDNPAITNGKVVFKKFFGGTIETKYPEE